MLGGKMTSRFVIDDSDSNAIEIVQPQLDEELESEIKRAAEMGDWEKVEHLFDIAVRRPPA